MIRRFLKRRVFETPLVDLLLSPNEWLGRLVVDCMKASMCSCNCCTVVKEVPFNDWPWRMENQVSIWLSQDARVGSLGGTRRRAGREFSITGELMPIAIPDQPYPVGSADLQDASGALDKAEEQTRRSVPKVN